MSYLEDSIYSADLKSSVESMDSSQITNSTISSSSLDSSLISSLDSSLLSSDLKESHEDKTVHSKPSEENIKLAQSDYFATDSALSHQTEAEPVGTVLGGPNQNDSQTISASKKKRNRKNKKKAGSDDDHHTEAQEQHDNQHQDQHDDEPSHQESQQENHQESQQEAPKTEKPAVQLPGTPLPFQIPLWEEELSLSEEQRRARYKFPNYIVTVDKVTNWNDVAKKLPITADFPTCTPNETLNNKIGLYHGNIVNLEIDAIVNAANRGLLGGGGVDGAIHSAAGPKLKEECRFFHGCPTGDARITRGYNLPAQFVIHTVGPANQNADDLHSSYRSSLQLVSEYGIRTVAFCGISTGVYGFPLVPASRIALTEIRSWLESNHANVDKIIICTFLQHEKECYEELLPEFFPPVRTEEELAAARKEKEERDRAAKELEEKERQEKERKQKEEEEKRKQEAAQKKEEAEKKRKEQEEKEAAEKKKKQEETERLEAARKAEEKKKIVVDHQPTTAAVVAEKKTQQQTVEPTLAPQSTTKTTATSTTTDKQTSTATSSSVPEQSSFNSTLLYAGAGVCVALVAFVALRLRR